MPAVFASKKFIAKLIGLVLIPVLAVANKKWDLGMTDADLLALVALIATYIAAQGYADGKTDGKTSGVVQAAPEVKS